MLKKQIENSLETSIGKLLNKEVYKSCISLLPKEVQDA